MASTMTHNVPKLKDPSLLKTDVAYVNGEWVAAKSGKTFEVNGEAFRAAIVREKLIGTVYRSFFWKVDWNCTGIRCCGHSEGDRCGVRGFPFLQAYDWARTIEDVEKVVRFNGMFFWQNDYEAETDNLADGECR